ncbi:hypothetical protein H112_05268 [Trichophyton rubrum D6]|uniref:Uncharacterized protein n=1 Tax=Trichophyton rubrum CBS 288.86 TaxID=1215330 RepID=A0A022VZM3_TRIRU|nr:hypothetical protein H100_05290 [Trichophyton rubrum MR850]EZF40797.1 hypothetical protein H102_05280 [Trichophyton rubrum CBS 100081]EZF51414.1 hypothetical protein H103_05281 [Trichophyton rubrum CBS 288.86]EZF83468.1 hypothetical protein H110_05278 [Trichophyton rubrum MR1448]EZG15697.1 hypothetical protein H107_05410 [Trichophyton rubrum CBS 202.88]KDB32655.1 hypothetical protein H112_05268 [Trichophyton rubrum D6]
MASNASVQEVSKCQCVCALLLLSVIERVEVEIEVDAKPSSPPWAVLPPPAALVAPRELLTKAAESRHLATEQTKKTRRSGTNNADRKTGADEMALVRGETWGDGSAD